MTELLAWFQDTFKSGSDFKVYHKSGTSTTLLKFTLPSITLADLVSIEQELTNRGLGIANSIGVHSFTVQCVQVVLTVVRLHLTTDQPTED